MIHKKGNYKFPFACLLCWPNPSLMFCLHQVRNIMLGNCLIMWNMLVQCSCLRYFGGVMNWYGVKGILLFQIILVLFIANISTLWDSKTVVTSDKTTTCIHRETRQRVQLSRKCIGSLMPTASSLMHNGPANVSKQIHLCATLHKTVVQLVSWKNRKKLYAGEHGISRIVWWLREPGMCPSFLTAPTDTVHDSSCLHNAANWMSLQSIWRA